MNRQTPRQDLRSAIGKDEERVNLLHPWAIVQLIDTNEVALIRSDLMSDADPRVTVQFIDNTARVLRGNTIVRVLANHSDVMYEQLRLMELSLAPSTGEGETTLHDELTVALGALMNDMEQRPGAYLKAGAQLEQLIGIVQGALQTATMKAVSEVQHA